MAADILKIIKDKKGKCNIKIYDEINNINEIYTYQNKNNIFYYYHCNKKPLCKGRGKFNINTNTFHIIKYCNNIEKHKEISYSEFIELIKNDKINDIDFNKIKNQRNLITYLFDKNKNIENINIIEEYYKYTKSKLEFTNKEISKIKTKILGIYRGLNIYECLNKININDIQIKIKSKEKNIK